MSSRILGMGDVLTLIDKAQATFDADKAKEMEKKLRSQQFTLDDFLDQLQQIKQMGPINQIMEMIPGMGKKMKGMSVDDKEFVKVEAIIHSMTPKERQEPGIINSSRRRRIALGSGTRVQDVNNLLKQFGMMQKMMKQFGKMDKGKMKGKGKGNFPFM